MSENPDDMPAATGTGGESDVVAERSGSSTGKSRRPVPAEPPESRDAPDWADDDRPEERGHAEGDEERPDIGPTG